MKDYLVVSLDGTLCNFAHRASYLKAGLWEKFHQHCRDDVPYPDVLELVKRLGSTMTIIAVTGRNARYRNITLDWLQRHGASIDALLMRPDEDFSKDAELKLDLLERYFGGSWFLPREEMKERVLQRVAFALENKEKTVKAFRNYGLPTWQVRPGD